MTTSVFFIGAGPGDPELITVRGQNLVRQADLVLYAGSLVPQAVVASAKKGAQVVDSAPLTLAETHSLTRNTVLAGGMVARVHTGDPALYGAVREQAALLEAEGIGFEIIPGVSAAFAAAARAKVSFTAPQVTQSLIITRLPGRTPAPESESLRSLAAHGSSLAVYLSADKATELARELRLARLPEDTVIIIGVKIGHADENIIRTTLAGLEKASQTLSRQAVFLILPAETAPSVPSRLYAPDFAHGFRRASRPTTWPRLAVYALTTQGLDLARRITHMDSTATDIFVPTRMAEHGLQTFSRLADQVRANFEQYHAHVFVAATGLVVRTIAPLLGNKTTDPAVVVCDQNGEHAISLVSGHLGRANELARQVAAHLGGRAVITTATDTAKQPAIDLLAQEHGCVIANPERIVQINTVLAGGGQVRIHNPENWLRLPGQSFITTDTPSSAQVVVSWKQAHDALTIHPPCLIAGIGCRRGTASQKILHALHEVFSSHLLAKHSLIGLASIDLKQDEDGLLDLARQLGLDVDFFDRKVLSATKVPNPSLRVQEKIGVASVCEAAALNAAWKRTAQARLVAPKTIVGPVTVAVALIRNTGA